MNKNNQPIGMMDSGIGGLTVLKATVEKLPNESIVYVGDTARMPYGPRNPEEVISFTKEIANYLIEKHNIKVLVIACNTATACALPIMKEELPIPVIGVIDSGVQQAVKTSQSNKIGVIATQGTVDSGKYQQEIATLAPNSEVFAQAEPDFVQFVEQNRYQSKDTANEVAKHLQPLKNKQIDTLILGCTHFPLLMAAIQQAIGPKVTLVDPGMATAEKLAISLEEHQLLNQNENKPQYHLYTTGLVTTFATIAKQWLGQQNDWHFEHVDLKTTD